MTLADIASVTSEAYGSGTTTSSPHTLPLQQKLVVCTLLMLARGRGKEVTVGGLRTAYVTVCERRQLRTEGEVEFVGLCDALEARGILTLKRSREARMTKVGVACWWAWHGVHSDCPCPVAAGGSQAAARRAGAGTARSRPARLRHGPHPADHAHTALAQTDMQLTDF